MRLRLGGELELTADSLSGPDRGLPPAGPAERHIRLLDTGRSALWLAADDAKRRLGRGEAWLPRYSCESVSAPFLSLGYRLRWYSTGSDLASPAGLPEDLSGALVVYIHYFGRRAAELEDLLGRRRGAGQDLTVVEDCVQAALTSGVGGFGDYSVFGWRKLLPA
ncbi:MAG: hypothetical protein KGL53_04730, partial [Elusimicrobia bacterium]|nr:hypothetical protein [Elusimicrobiota bacterium]